MQPASPRVFDVPALLERSRPRPRGPWLFYALGVFLLIVLISTYVSAHSPAMAGAVDLISKLSMVALMVGMAVLTSVLVRRQREELRRVEALEELVQLRRWNDAANLAQEILSTPARTPQARAQALIYFASILARYHQFEDAIAVYNHLLETFSFDEGTSHGIRLGRGMAMLREDHLVDADAAISELRRMTQGRDSAGLAIIELYRDVKTGHPAEAIDHFPDALPLFRQQLGHRTGDAYALLAKSYDLLGYTAEAQDAYEKATLLTAVSELNRRYPEVATLSGKYKSRSTRSKRLLESAAVASVMRETWIISAFVPDSERCACKSMESSGSSSIKRMVAMQSPQLSYCAS